jgi:hypothetical protein
VAGGHGNSLQLGDRSGGREFVLTLHLWRLDLLLLSKCKL